MKQVGKKMLAFLLAITMIAGMTLNDVTIARAEEKAPCITLSDGVKEEVNETTASLTVAQLLFLEAEDPSKDIQLYINSPGGSVTAGMAIYDTMRYIKCDVSTICIGMAASMALSC